MNAPSLAESHIKSAGRKQADQRKIAISPAPAITNFPIGLHCDITYLVVAGTKIQDHSAIFAEASIERAIGMIASNRNICVVIRRVIA